MALHSIDGLGPVRLKAILDYFKDPKLAWEAPSSELIKLGIPKPTVDLLTITREKLDPLAYIESIQKSGIKWLSIFDDSYPKLLKEIYDPPIVFYYRGEIIPQDEKAIAVVGSRKMTGYGEAVTEQFVTELSQAGLTIISGLARGVDTKAHITAIRAGGRTIAVLGGGLNKIYPAENVSLARQIASGFGATISEFPPDYPSIPGNFPARNRIISGLSLGVLVTEAASDSGSLITAREALEQGREVFAVPGPITSMSSVGSLNLIKQGATIVTSAEDILGELGVNKQPRSSLSDGSNLTDLSEEERKILSLLKVESLHIDQICQKLNLPASMVSASLIKMEIAGVVKSLGGGIFCVV